MLTSKPQARRMAVARQIALYLHRERISSSAARIAGIGGRTPAQWAAERNFRWAAAAGAKCRLGYIPSEETWAEVVSQLEVIEDAGRG